MRNGWIRDIADYAKYGILRRLAGSDLRLVVLWYLNHLPSRQPITAYLSRPEVYEVGDGDLFKGLTRLHAMGYPTVEDVAREGILPPNTLFYDEPLAWESQDGTRHHANRANWFAQAIEASAQAHLVFLDPDTGLDPGIANHRPRRVELYATIDEILTFVDHGQTGVVIQFGRPGNLETDPELARAHLQALSGACLENGFPSPWGLWWREMHKVAFLVAPTRDQDNTLARRRDDLLSDDWWGRRLSKL